MLDTKFENIPLALQQRPQWVAWRGEKRTLKDGTESLNKIPIDAKTGASAKSDDHATWTTFEQAVAHAQNNGLAGVGFVFCDADGFTGVDFDDCIDEQGTIHPEVEALLARLDSYSEVSPSGRGIKTIVKAKFPLNSGHKIQKGSYAIEVYNSKRYFTVTGHRLEKYPADVIECKDAEESYHELFGPPPAAQSILSKPTGLAPSGANLSLADEAERIREALGFIDPEDYETWLRIGFALKWWSTQGAGELAKTLWDDWSARSGKFQQSASNYKWTTFDAQGQLVTDQSTGNQSHRLITLGTLFKIAHDSGWSGTTMPKTKLPEVVLPPGGGSINDVGSTLGALLDQTGQVYARGDVLVELGHDENRERVLKPVVSARAPSLFEEVAALRKVDKDGNRLPAFCPEHMAKLIVHSKRFIEELPPINLITACPVLVKRASGELIEVNSYDRESGVMAGGEPTVVCKTAEAKALLNEVIADFDFTGPGDRARALASLITPALQFARLIPGRSPIHVTEANVSQAGKGYRNRLTAAIYRHTIATVSKKTGGGVGSTEETFDTHLISGRPFISFDNIRGVLDSQKLESFCTEDAYAARIPHCAAITIDPRRYVLMITANKAEFPPDLVNRSSIVRIKKRLATYRYKTYPEGDILAHVLANQPRYLGAVHAVLMEWYMHDCPCTTLRQHDFSAWAQRLDWIVQNLLEAGPLLDDHAEVQQRVGNPYLNWLRDVSLAVFNANKENYPLKTIQIVSILERHNLAALADFLKPGDRLADEEVQSRVLKAMGKRLSGFFDDQKCTRVDAHTVCREEVTTDKVSGSGTRTSKVYMFSRPVSYAPEIGTDSIEDAGNGQNADSKDVKPPLTPNPPPTESEKPPITPMTPDDPKKIKNENSINNIVISNPGPHGGNGGLQSFNGGFQKTDGGDGGLLGNSQKPLPSNGGSSPAQRRSARPHRPAGGGLTDPPPPKPLIDKTDTLEEFAKHFTEDHPQPPKPPEAGPSDRTAGTANPETQS